MPDWMETWPSVYAVGREYQICLPVRQECTMWVRVGEKDYCDHSNGILRSGKFLHIVHVPCEALERERRYTVCLREIRKRRPYFTECGEVQSREYCFEPLVKKEEYHIINLADTHSLTKAPVGSGSFFGEKLDLLVMNGDIPDDSGEPENFRAIYLISGAVSKGRVPCVFARGNHDMRGIYEEQLADYTPTDGGKSYYTFRLGPVWGIVLDAGEDKEDGNPEYGHMVCCEAFREEEEDFLNRVIAAKEYEQASVRLIVSHHPFAHCIKAPFDIEQERYAGWSQMLKKLRPTVWLTGHLHECFLESPGGAHDTYGYPCPVVCSSDVDVPENRHIVGAVTITAEGIRVRYVSESGQVVGDETVTVHGTGNRNN